MSQPTTSLIQNVIGDIGHIAELLKDRSRIGKVAVVNAANAHLLPGGGVTGALVRSVGGSQTWMELVKDAKLIDGKPFNSKKGLQLGQVAWTDVAGQLEKDDVFAIIHTRGPVAFQDDIATISDVITNTLSMADHLGIETLILPAISGGIFAAGDPEWPIKIRKLIRESIKDYFKHHFSSLEHVYLISYDENDQQLWFRSSLAIRESSPATGESSPATGESSLATKEPKKQDKSA